MTDKCKKTVFRQGGSYSGGRCSRKAVKDGFCKQHHPDMVAKRSAEIKARWKAEDERNEAKWAQKRRQREDAKRFAALCARPELFNTAFRLWDGGSDFRIAFDKAMREVQP